MNLLTKEQFLSGMPFIRENDNDTDSEGIYRYQVTEMDENETMQSIEKFSEHTNDFKFHSFVTGISENGFTGKIEIFYDRWISYDANYSFFKPFNQDLPDNSHSHE